MTLFGIVWIVTAPYLTGGLVAFWPRANRIVAQHIAPAMTVGWSALAIVLVGTIVVGGHVGAWVAVTAAPLVGLAYWARGDGSDGGDDPPRDEPEGPEPPSDWIDWDAFERVRRHWEHQPAGTP